MLTANQYQFMLRTGKYLPDENIKFDDVNYHFEHFDSNINRTYYENSTGYWEKYVYDSNSNCTYFEDSDGDWGKSEFDSNNNYIYHEYSNGYWYKQTFDDNSNCTYHEDSNGDWNKNDSNGIIIESGNYNDR